MAKDVDLTSREWSDIVFEGRNKSYGAYVLRVNSKRRHLKAFIFTVIGLLAIGIGVSSYLSVQAVLYHYCTYNIYTQYSIYYHCHTHILQYLNPMWKQ